MQEPLYTYIVTERKYWYPSDKIQRTIALGHSFLFKKHGVDDLWYLPAKVDATRSYWLAGYCEIFRKMQI